MDKHKYDFLIEEAKKLIQSRYCKEGHHTVVAAALLANNGKVYSALNVGTYQPSISTCAEIITIGMALKENRDLKIEAIACVRDDPAYIISPCGKCREYIADYSDDALVCVPVGAADYEFVPVSELLPNKYVKKV
ncbi:MAG: cytidine deaminase [Alphaproteobacteria bacterium]|nr:cytidine deaminase [Alphaproteobacteria bacterium]